MFKDAKVGDRVWSVLSGWGIITEISSYPYPIYVAFDNNETNAYTFDGKNWEADIYSELYWDEVKITPPSKPKRLVKKQIVAYANVYGDDNFCVHLSQDSAEHWLANGCIAPLVPLYGEYEIEE